MANIMQMISKEVEKGNVLLDKKGNFLPTEKVEATLKKAYLTGLKDGSVSFEKSFEDFKNAEIEKGYLPTSAVVRTLETFFPNDTPEIPAPVESEATTEETQETEPEKKKVAK